VAANHRLAKLTERGSDLEGRGVMAEHLKQGDPQIDALSEAELTKYFDDHKDDPSLWEQKGRRIRARRGPSTVFQMRIAPEELEEIAEVAGGNVSDFVRTAALEKARRIKSNKEPSVAEQVKEQVRHLSDTVSKL
jgi:hypothetical protein